MKKNIVLYLSKSFTWVLKKPFQEHSLRFQIQTEALADFFSSDTIQVFLTQSKISHVWENTFIPQFIKKWDKWETHNKEVTADFVLGSYIPEAVTRKLFSLKHIFIDKKKTENLFPEYIIKSIICENYSEIQESFPKISSTLKVLKPQFWTQWKWIFIQEKIPKEEEIEQKFYPYILQEFFDTSEGFGTYSWIHDFRVIILNGKIIGKVLRQPNDGWFISNTSQSGKIIDLENYVIPEKIQDIINDIDSYFGSISPERLYSIDFGIWVGGEIKIFEMNGSPALSFPHITHKLWSYIIKKTLKDS